MRQLLILFIFTQEETKTHKSYLFTLPEFMLKCKWWSQDLKIGILFLELECLAVTLYGISNIVLLPHSLLSLIFLPTHLFCLLCSATQHVTPSLLGSTHLHKLGCIYGCSSNSLHNIMYFSKQTLLHCFCVPTRLESPVAFQRIVWSHL